MTREPKDLKINDKWFIDLDPYLDIERFEAMHDELAEGIARSMQHVEPVVIGSKPAQFDMSLSEVEVALQEHKDTDQRLAKLIAEGASRQVLYDYVKFAHPSVALGKKILLRTYKNYHSAFGLKHLSRMNVDMPAYQHFEGLRKFIDDSGVFREIGRIIIFLTERHALAEPHCDYADGKSRKDQFLWLNPRRAKKFYVLDTEFQKHYLTGVANTFDNATWHGGDPAEFATFTIRVDGMFSRKFLDQTGLRVHYG
jgi:hypothetical protein